MSDLGGLKVVRCPDGGLMAEVFRSTDLQLNVRTVPPGAEKDGHRHPLAAERWWLVAGELEVWLEAADGSAHRFTLRASNHLEVPAGRGHRVANRGEAEAVLAYATDRPWDGTDKEDWDGWR